MMTPSCSVSESPPGPWEARAGFLVSGPLGKRISQTTPAPSILASGTGGLFSSVTLFSMILSMGRQALPRPPCERCGAPTRTPQNRFCGRACSAASRSTAIERHCERCGRAFPFHPTPSAVAREAGRYCSRGCQHAARRVHQRPRELPCAVCGTPFLTSGRAASTRYCSKACAGRARSEAVASPPCAQCRKPCPRKRQRYCSRACAGLASRRRIARTCPVCGVGYEIFPSDVKAGVRLRCSMRCWGIAHRRRVEVRCQRAGCDQTVTLARLAASRRRYCSRQCCGLAHRTGVEQVCRRDGCEQLLWVQPSQLAQGEGKYCSNACRTIASRLRYPRVSVRCRGCRKRVTAPAWRKRLFCSNGCANRGRPRRRDPALVARDARILELAAHGLTSPMIAAQLAQDPAWIVTPAGVRQVIRRAG